MYSQGTDEKVETVANKAGHRHKLIFSHTEEKA